ncbi:MAG: ATP-dependent DNA helicase RecG [Muribaculaceae bacterium]|nr:ATP-dependent DNA helicase RecG [Muribaculaceae bacterium]
MNSLREYDVKFIKGIGPGRAELLKQQLGIKSAYDLVRHFPTGYVDRSKVWRIIDFNGDMPSVQIKGRFLTFNIMGEGAKARLVGLFTDGTSQIEVIWFRQVRKLRDAYHTGNEYILFGRPTFYEATRTWSMIHPEVDSVTSPSVMTGFRGVYPLTEKLRNQGVGSRQLAQWIQSFLFSRKNINETLPPSVMERLGLMPLQEALITIHKPIDNDSLQRARLRLKFEELFYIAVDMMRRNLKRRTASRGQLFGHIGNFFNRFYNECLPFELTGAQKRVIREIRSDVNTGRQMNRLVQGDVGSGKTLVALMAMLIAIDNGAQACLMAPTEILATQHYETLKSMVSKIGLDIRLLTGSTRAVERRAIHEGLIDGSVHLLVGTHALIEDSVQFKNLGMAVIDEQHRFGVVQRARLWTKNALPPHVLVMTATPIPRTLAMTVYGDLDVSVIDELPPGRKPISTVLRYENDRHHVYRGLGSQLRAGHQAYIVYPLIDENVKLDLLSLKEGYETICETFPSYKVAFVHGRMKPAEKDYQMGLFASGEAQILVATTVIEVGVNVPNATTMIIENAERFGLSQLHQLRGRVGRGGDQSYCVLMSKHEIARETRRRLELMTRTTDGFEIAEADMKWRGPGDIEGTMQSGIAFDLHIANLAQDGQIIQLARDNAEMLLKDDSDLTLPENRTFAVSLQKELARSADWSRIS